MLVPGWAFHVAFMLQRNAEDFRRFPRGPEISVRHECDMKSGFHTCDMEQALRATGRGGGAAGNWRVQPIEKCGQRSMVSRRIRRASLNSRGWSPGRLRKSSQARRSSSLTAACQSAGSSPPGPAGSLRPGPQRCRPCGSYARSSGRRPFLEKGMLWVGAVTAAVSACFLMISCPPGWCW